MKSTNKVFLSAIMPNRAVILIPDSSSASVGTADHMISKSELRTAALQHINDVARGLKFIAGLIKEAGENHDHTKIEKFEDYFNYFRKAQETGVKSWEWCNEIHAKEERHHIEQYHHEDVNLIDVLEHIVDGVMAGIGRSGEYTPDNIPSELLVKAYRNTQNLVAGLVRRED